MTDQQHHDLGDDHREFYRAMRAPLYWTPDEPPAEAEASDDED